MTIVAVVSSPEKNGNTETAVNAIADAIKANGKEVKFFYTNQMYNKKGCQACNACKTQGKCVQFDDTSKILDAIRNAEGFILSTPVYFDRACGQYGILEDRFYSFLDMRFQPNIEVGKKCAVVTAAGSSNAQRVADEIAANMKNFFKCEIVGTIAMITGNKRDYAKNSPEVLAQAAEIGKKF